MHRAKMRAPAVDNFSQYNAFAVFLSTFFSGAAVDLVVKLKFAGQAMDIAVVGR